ncbi:MAG: formate dehydrogenase accessory sulfurtransferase FdhD [Thermomicrobiales bacterium]
MADPGGPTREDRVATEEPLEIRVEVAGRATTVAVTMRTPGADFELAAGFLMAEGVVRGREDIRQIGYCVDAALSEEQRYNVVTVRLRPTATVDLAPLERHFSITSACGVCGKTSLDDLSVRGLASLPPGLTVSPGILAALPETVRARQRLFDATGGLHAAALCTPEGEVIAVREDVGRHNALDKLLGWAMLEGMTPIRDGIVWVSGRASYELAQKCVAAGVPVLCAVSAPSSLAIDVAERFGLTLVGFLRDGRGNIYHDPGRIVVGTG